MKTFVFILMTGMALVLAACGGGQGREAYRQTLQQGVEYARQNDVYKALEAFQKVMDLSRKADDDTTFFEASVRLSLLYSQAAHYEESRRLLDSLPFLKIPGSLVPVFYLRQKAFLAAHLHKDYNRSRQLIEQCVRLEAECFPDDKYIQHVENANLGELYYMMGDTASAWRMVRRLEAIGHWNKLRDLCLSEVYYVHGALLLDRGNIAEAQRYADSALCCSRRYGYVDTEVLALTLRCRIDS